MTSTPTQIEPATDVEIARLEYEVAAGAMIFEIRNHEMERILARIRAVREQTIFECAEIARTWAQDNETIQPSYNGITNSILALLTNKGEQR